MAKVTGPLLSFGATGQIGKAQVYASWKGVQYARRHVIPANPNSSDQVLTRSVFSWLQAEWKNLPASLSAPWTTFAKGKPLTNRNAFTKSNLHALRAASDIQDLILSPSTGGAPAFTGFSAAGGVGKITVSADDPDVPTGWTLTKWWAAALADGDPHSYAAVVPVVGSQATTVFTVDLTVPAGDYVGVGFYEYADANSVAQYSASQVGAATAT